MLINWYNFGIFHYSTTTNVQGGGCISVGLYDDTDILVTGQLQHKVQFKFTSLPHTSYSDSHF